MIKNSLKNKLMVSILLIIFVFGAMAVYVIFLYSKNQLIEREKLNLEINVVEKSHEIKQIFYGAQSLAETISKQDFVVDYFKKDKRYPQDKNVLSRLESYNVGNAYSSIYLLDQDGLTLVSTDELFVGNNYSFRDYFIEAKKKSSFIDVSIGLTSKELGYYFSQSIEDSNHNFLGVLVLKMKPEFINNFVSLTEAETMIFSENISLIDNYGIVVYSDNNDFFLKSFLNLSEKDLKEIDEKKRFLNINIDNLGYDIKKKELSSVKQSHIFELTNSINNTPYIISVSRVDNFPFFIVLEEKKDIFFIEAVRASYLLGFFVLIAAFFAGVFIFIYINRFIKPLVSLNDIVKKVSAGDLSQKAIITTEDEIGELGGNFNKMTSKLRDNIESIEEKIIERTNQLEKINKIMVGRELKMVGLKNEILELKNKLKT